MVWSGSEMKITKPPLSAVLTGSLMTMMSLSVYATETYTLSGSVESFANSETGLELSGGRFEAVYLYNENTVFEIGSSKKRGLRAWADNVDMALDIRVFDGADNEVYADLLAFDPAFSCPEGQSGDNSSEVGIGDGVKGGDSISIWYDFYCIASSALGYEDAFEIYIRDKSGSMVAAEDVSTAFPDLELLNGYGAKLWFYRFDNDSEIQLTAVVESVIAGPLDSDGDGYSDDIDACVDSDLSPTVVINGIDTGVTNTLDATGCTISDLTSGEAAEEPLSQSELNAVSRDLMKAGLITGAEKGAITSAAARNRGKGRNK
jgi:hypothetical protein